MKVVRTKSGYRKARVTDSFVFWLAVAVAEGIATHAIPFFM